MPNIINSDFLTITPRTQAELATYTFEVNLKSAVTTSDTVNIVFPDSIPRGLSYLLECEAEKLGGIVECEAEGRTLTVKGSKDYAPDTVDDKERLTLEVRYVYNPNNGYGLSNFIIFTKNERTIIDYGELDDSSQFNGYPAYMELTAGTSTNIFTLF
mmetsp:Transcript_8336/g.1109  ORF Transcript_8336/g.1109 Transcript_8336/m.1109 type:complete len:157 (-) Transcript_8336:2220-2690(-)|eukprot:CAMPEP_0168315246 /NCGR_PEP_ID=MMETSP0210-20121227/10588_1 /TAXON_ID=40633 /ORGANISM="Condylostoma magnum, Strain COL2" /LENGTH=156 /DNA_ID=CAMNT_0008287289 /DNA_START=3480 /DNA_END=3950 /DNA_ORIENTATION=+